MNNRFYADIPVKALMEQFGVDETVMELILNNTAEIQQNAVLYDLHEAITMYLDECPYALSEDLDIDDMAETIINVATAYVTACEEEITVEQMQEKIGSTCAELTEDQAMLYAAGLHIFLEQMNNDLSASNDEKMLQKLVAKYEELTAHGINTSASEHIEALIRQLDTDKVGAMFRFADSDELIGALKNGAIATSAHTALHLNRLYADIDSIAALSAAVYIEYALGNVSHFADRLSPGLVTACVAHSMNTARVAYASATNQITHEEAMVHLNILDRAFAVAFALALTALVLIGGALIAIVLAAFLIEVGAHAAICSSVALLIILAAGWNLADTYDQFKETIVETIVEIKTMTRPLVQKAKTAVTKTVESAKKRISNHETVMA